MFSAAGFADEALDIILGVSFMEADGPACTKRFGVRSAYADAVGDLAQLEDPEIAKKWGPSIGLSQARSLRNPRIWGTADRWRIGRLLRDPWFNAVAAFWISKGGTDFVPWTMFQNQLYLPHKGLDYEVRTGHPRAAQWDQGYTPPPAPPPEPVFTTSAKLGQWVVAPGHFVNNNVWNDLESGSQTLRAWSPSRWEVIANHSRTDVRPGSIKSYPDTQKNFTNRSIASFAEMTATWSTEFPAVGEWIGAFDNWIGGIGSKCTAEVMLWTHHRYNGALPPPNAVESTTVTIAGHAFVAWRRPLNDKGLGQQYIALAMIDHKPIGSVDLLAVFRWLVDKGWLKGTDLVAAIEYGVEIANTAGGSQTFRLNNYTLTAQ